MTAATKYVSNIANNNNEEAAAERATTSSDIVAPTESQTPLADVHIAAIAKLMNGNEALIAASKLNAGLLANAQSDAANAAQAAKHATEQAQSATGASYAGGTTLFGPPSLGWLKRWSKCCSS